MNVLVVEDDGFKFSKIEILLKEIIPDRELVHCDNVFDTLAYLRKNTPDKIILDMSLPSHPARPGEGSPLSMPSGGIEVILELRYIRKNKIPIIVLTQYPDVEIENEYYSMVESEGEIQRLYGIENIVVRHYENDSNDWMDSTTEFLRCK